MVDDSMEISSDHGLDNGEEDIDIDIDFTAGQVDEDYILEDAASDAALEGISYDLQSPIIGNDDLMMDEDNASYQMVDADFIHDEENHEMGQETLNYIEIETEDVVYTPAIQSGPGGEILEQSDVPWEQTDLTETLVDEVDTHQENLKESSYNEGIHGEQEQEFNEPDSKLLGVKNLGAEAEELGAEVPSQHFVETTQDADIKHIELAEGSIFLTDASTQDLDTTTENKTGKPETLMTSRPNISHPSSPLQEMDLPGPSTDEQFQVDIDGDSQEQNKIEQVLENSHHRETSLNASESSEQPPSNDAHISLPVHEVVVIYQTLEYALFAAHDSDDPNSFFISDLTIVGKSLEYLFQDVRRVIYDDLSDDDELYIIAEDLGLEIHETSTSCQNITMEQLLSLHKRLYLNDGIESVPSLRILLETRTNFLARFIGLKRHAEDGKGISEVLTPDVQLNHHFSPPDDKGQPDEEEVVDKGKSINENFGQEVGATYEQRESENEEEQAPQDSSTHKSPHGEEIFCSLENNQNPAEQISKDAELNADTTTSGGIAPRLETHFRQSPARDITNNATNELVNYEAEEATGSLASAAQVYTQENIEESGKLQAEGANNGSTPHYSGNWSNDTRHGADKVEAEIPSLNDEAGDLSEEYDEDERSTYEDKDTQPPSQSIERVYAEQENEDYANTTNKASSMPVEEAVDSTSTPNSINELQHEDIHPLTLDHKHPEDEIRTHNRNSVEENGVNIQEEQISKKQEFEEPYEDEDHFNDLLDPESVASSLGLDSSTESANTLQNDEIDYEEEDEGEELNDSDSIKQLKNTEDAKDITTHQELEDEINYEDDETSLLDMKSTNQDSPTASGMPIKRPLEETDLEEMLSPSRKEAKRFRA